MNKKQRSHFQWRVCRSNQLLPPHQKHQANDKCRCRQPAPTIKTGEEIESHPEAFPQPGDHQRRSWIKATKSKPMGKPAEKKRCHNLSAQATTDSRVQIPEYCDIRQAPWLAPPKSTKELWAKTWPRIKLTMKIRTMVPHTKRHTATSACQ